MTTLTWSGVSGGNTDWFVPTNWTPSTTPSAGDTAIVYSGTPTIIQDVVGETIVLSGLASALPISLTATDVTFSGSGTGSGEVNTQLIVTGGHPVSAPLDALFVADGTTSFDGQIIVSAVGGSLTIDAEDFSFLNTDQKAVMVVSQESGLIFTGHSVINDGIIQVDGGVSITAGVSFTGTGTITLEDGGHLTLWGAIGTGLSVDFVDGTGSATLASGSNFAGVFGFTNVGGNRIDLAGILAHSEKLESDILTLYSGSNQTGQVVGSLSVQEIDPEHLIPFPNQWTASDFTLSSDGNGGTLVTYSPQGPVLLQQSLPTPIVAQAGTYVSLSSILTQAFGTDAPNFYQISLLPTHPGSTTTPGDDFYWTNVDITPTWYVEGQAVTAPTVVTDINDVQLLVGNQIDGPAQFQVRVTSANSGTSSEYVTYSAWMVDPRIQWSVQNAGFGGVPTPGAVVASANAFNETFPNVPNTNLCNWIGDNVGAGAGAPMPYADAALDPTLNVSGGFWRIGYTGTGPDPVSNWSMLIQPGDVVRLGWFKPENGLTSGHTTTILGYVNSDGMVSVFDNIDYSTGPETIGIHDANYWLKTDPADITIYRLDPNKQYLIEGTSLAENIQGSIYNDLIQPGGGADVITSGPGKNEIQDTTAHLNGVTVTDFKPGDTLDFADLYPSQTSVAYHDGALHVLNNHAEVAAVTMPTPSESDFFVITPDGNGGASIGLVDPEMEIQLLYVGYLGRAGDPVGTLFWLDQLLSSGQSAFTSIASSFSVSPEAQAEYSFFADPQHATLTEITAFVTALYQDLFGRTPDTTGLTYWTNYLSTNLASAATVSTFPLTMITGAQNGLLALDATTINNKAIVSEFLVQQFTAAHIDFGNASSPASTLAHVVVAQVNQTQASVAAAEAAVTDFIHQHLVPLVGVAAAG